MKNIQLANITAPDSEFSTGFLTGMLHRMSLSFFKYGPVKDAFPQKVDAIATLRMFLDRYERDGNTERMMDVANYAMIEFMHPRHPNAHFTPTDTRESPGRKWHDEVDPSHRSHRVERLEDE